jgi:activating signal cointegrator complex subunit 1
MPEEKGEYEIKKTSTGFVCDLTVDPKFYNAIIGPKGATVTKIRQSTGCNINVPKKDSPSTSIHFSGATREAVDEAIKGVLFIIQSTDLSAAAARPKRLEFDFFVSVPLLDESFATRLESFYAEIKELISRNETNVDPKSFMRPCTLHFTLTMLHLHTPSKIVQAQDLLRSLAPKVTSLTQNKPLTVDWGRLQTFQTSLDRASIVYMEPGPEATKFLKPVGELIRQAFIDAGLVADEKEEQRPLVLHATLINSRSAFDATKIFALKSAAFPPFNVNEIQLSQRFNYDENGYYHCVEAIPLQ